MRWWPAVVLGAVVAAVLWPLTQPRADDSFPLSNYPMFTAAQPRLTSVHRAVGIDARGAERILPPRLAGGTSEVMHANRTIQRAVADGSADRLCREIAGRVAPDRSFGDVDAVAVVVERYDAVAAITVSRPAPEDRRVVAHCAVGR